MAKIEIRKVTTKKDLKTFIDFHYDLYAESAYDVPALFADEMNTLSKDKNAAFEFCDAEYFLAYKDNTLAGRVAAIINNRANSRWNQKNVRFGWIDFINDIEVLKALVDAVEAFGKQHGMTHVVGPLGFTDMDPEGMLTFGFDRLGTMPTIYNYDYYPQLFEQLGGYDVDNRYNEYLVQIPDAIPEKFKKVSEMIMKRYNLHIRKIKRSEVFGKEQMGQKLFEIINATYKDLYGYSEMTERQIHQTVKMFAPVLDMELMTFIEDWNTPEHKVIGAGISISSLSHALRKCHRGRLFPCGWWHVLRALKFHKSEGIDLLLIGILPEYRTKGANALLFYDLIPYYQKYRYKWAETQVEMADNKAVQGQWDAFEHENHKRRVCWKKAL